MAWTEIAIDGEPATDMSGSVTLYQVYDENAAAPTVILTGRFNDTWMYGYTPTHWQLWFGSDDPVTDPGIWTEVATEGEPAFTAIPVLYEIYDGSSTGLTARFQEMWIVPADLTVTHWKLPTLDTAPA